MTKAKVKSMFRTTCKIGVCVLALLFTGCDLYFDLFGLVASQHDVEERLKERDNFTFIERYGDLSPKVGDSYSFMVVADTHIYDDLFGLDKLLTVITPDIKFLVILGDITENGSRCDIYRFMEFAASVKNMGVPVYPVIGNHDVYFGNWTVWKELIGSTNYRIDGDNITFFIMDSANAFFGDGQLDRLERGLGSANRDVFVFTHANLFVENPPNIQQVVDVRERARVVSALRGKADIMFMGHQHKTMTHEIGGVKYVSIDAFRDLKTYCVVTVTGGDVSYAVKNL